MWYNMLLRSWKAAPGSVQAELTNYCLHTQTDLFAAVGRQQQPTALRLFAMHCTDSYQEQLNKVIAAKLIASLFLQRYNILGLFNPRLFSEYLFFRRRIPRIIILYCTLSRITCLGDGWLYKYDD